MVIDMNSEITTIGWLILIVISAIGILAKTRGKNQYENHH